LSVDILLLSIISNLFFILLSSVYVIVGLYPVVLQVSTFLESHMVSADSLPGVSRSMSCRFNLHRWGVAKIDFLQMHSLYNSRLWTT